MDIMEGALFSFDYELKKEQQSLPWNPIVLSHLHCPRDLVERSFQNPFKHYAM